MEETIVVQDVVVIETAEDPIEVKTVSMRRSDWEKVDRVAALMDGSRSWALRYIVAEYERLKEADGER